MKKMICVLLIAVLSTMMFSCKKPGTPGDETNKETQSLNIFMSSSTISAKSDDNYVKSKIEEKFFKDTGKKIDLKVQVYNEADFNTVMSNKMAGSSWDAAIGYLGQAGIDEIMIKENVCMEIGDLVKSYNALNNLVKNNLDATTTIDGSVYGIPSLEMSNKYGILARKDYMDKVGYTIQPGHSDDLGDIKTPAVGKKRSLVNIEDFTDMMRRMKAQNLCKYPLSGYPWDVEYTLTVGAFSSSSYMTKAVVRNPDGTVKEVIPGQLSKDYQRSIQYEYEWANEGLWEEEAYTGQKTNKINAFVNGTTGIYVVDAEITNLINMARQTKKNDSNAEFEIIQPLYGVDEKGRQLDTRGFMKRQSSTCACVLNKKSSKAEVMMEYLNWLASDKANYNLATYGVEGEHWVDAKEDRYQYPEGKKDKFEAKPPYSGMYSLLKWELYSYKTYDNYTAQEYKWIDQVRSFPTYSNPCDNMLFIGEETDMALNHQTAENDFFQDCLVKAWQGILDPKESYSQAAQKYRKTASEYITWLTAQYNKYMIARG